MPIRPLLFCICSALAVLGLTSCQTAKKRSADKNKAPLLSPLAGNPEVSEETVAALKAIADDPASQLPVAEPLEAEAPESATDEAHNVAMQFPGRDVFDPTTEWKKPGIDPLSVSPGDIFTENAGPVLNKELSLADSLSEEQRKALFRNFTSAGTTRVPMTISTSEMAALREQAKANGDEVALPSRSVALDFRAYTYAAESAKLERLLEGSGEEQEKTIQEIKDRIRKGEKLYVITSVTESETLRATYPGAPVGKRDAEPIRNAVQQLYPHLRNLEAEKQDRSITISGSPRVLWEFEAKELKVDNDKLVIDSTSLVQL